MKNEYQRTRNKIVGKSHFPGLLSQLWTKDAIKDKTNIIKSFMKTGIFPLNPASIDRAKILNNATCVNANISETIDPNMCCGDQINSSNSHSTFDVSVALNNSHTSVTDPSMDNVSNTTDTTISNFNSSVQAISVLDRVLNETRLSSDAEDEDYLPNRSTNTLTRTTMLSNSQQYHPQENSTSHSQQLNTSRRNYRKRKTHPKIIDIESTNEEGSSVVSSLRF